MNFFMKKNEKIISTTTPTVKEIKTCFPDKYSRTCGATFFVK